jgi:hypothetical protein
VARQRWRGMACAKSQIRAHIFRMMHATFRLAFLFSLETPVEHLLMSAGMSLASWWQN